MFLVQIDSDGNIERVAKQLGLPYDKSAQWIASALNETSRRTATLLKQAIRKHYTYNRNDKLKGAFTVGTKATKTNQVAILNVKSEAPHLTDFKVKPNAPSKINHGAVMAQIKKDLKAKALISDKEGNPKAFIAKFSNGKLAVVQRVPGKVYGPGAQRRAAKYGAHSDMTKIKALFGPRITSMANAVYEDSVAAETGVILQKAIEKQIAKTITKMTEGK